MSEETRDRIERIAHQQVSDLTMPCDHRDILIRCIATAEQAIAEEKTRDLQEETANLRRTWGREYEANLHAAARVAHMAGLDPKTHPIFTSAEVVQAFARLSKLILSTDQLESAAIRYQEIYETPANQSGNEIPKDIEGLAFKWASIGRGGCIAVERDALQSELATAQKQLQQMIGGKVADDEQHNRAIALISERQSAELNSLRSQLSEAQDQFDDTEKSRQQYINWYYEEENMRRQLEEKLSEANAKLAETERQRDEARDCYTRLRTSQAVRHTNEQILLWAGRHDVKYGSLLDLRCMVEDACSLSNQGGKTK